MNPYAYARGNPLRYNDPSGKDWNEMSDGTSGIDGGTVDALQAVSGSQVGAPMSPGGGGGLVEKALAGALALIGVAVAENSAMNPGLDLAASKGVVPEAGLGMDSGNRGLLFALETTGSKNPTVRAYEDGAPGWFPAANGGKWVPALQFDNPNPRGRDIQRFDGQDQSNPNMLIDRKWTVHTGSDSQKKIAKMAEALRQNPEYMVRIEVTNATQEKAFKRLLAKAGVSRDQFEIKVVEAEKPKP